MCRHSTHQCHYGGQQKFYNRWIGIIEKTRIPNECKLITNLFQSFNFAIRSVSDIAFGNNTDNAIKEKALIKLLNSAKMILSTYF